MSHRICAWCGIVTGQIDAPRPSHSICPACLALVRATLPKREAAS